MCNAILCTEVSHDTLFLPKSKVFDYGEAQKFGDITFNIFWESIKSAI